MKHGHAQSLRAQQMLASMWVDPPGYFARAPQQPATRFAFTNYGVSLGLQATGLWPERVKVLNNFFEHWRSGNEYDGDYVGHGVHITLSGRLRHRKRAYGRVARTHHGVGLLAWTSPIGH